MDSLKYHISFKNLDLKKTKSERSNLKLSKIYSSQQNLTQLSKKVKISILTIPKYNYIFCKL